MNENPTDAEEQLKLGLNYANGYGVPKDMEKSIYWFTKAAEQGNVIAQCNLGIGYANGYGVPKDMKKAIYWYTKAAEQGNIDAQRNLKICYFKGDGVPKDMEKAIYWSIKVAEQGDVIAQYNLGFDYSEGDGVPKDMEKAIYWFTKAAEQGLDKAQHNLGVCYLKGNGVSKDLEKAAYWFTKAAEQGDADAQNNLRIIKGMKELITKSAEHGDTDAKKVQMIYVENKKIIAEKEKLDAENKKLIAEKEMLDAENAKEKRFQKWVTILLISLVLLIGIILIVKNIVISNVEKEEEQEQEQENTITTTSDNFTDPRDNKTYKTIKIGEQTWMAENLNYEVKGSECYNHNPENCQKYGRLYHWEPALKACPNGWHLPKDYEWETLVDYIGSDARRKLKSKSGWDEGGNGTDEYGFSALPSGTGKSDGTFVNFDKYSYWWSVGEGTDAYYRYITPENSNLNKIKSTKKGLFPVRCIQD